VLVGVTVGVLVGGTGEYVGDNSPGVAVGVARIVVGVASGAEVSGCTVIGVADDGGVEVAQAASVMLVNMSAQRVACRLPRPACR